MSKKNLVEVIGMVNNKIADHNPAMPMHVIKAGARLVLPYDIATLAQSIGYARIAGDSTEEGERKYNEHTLKQLGFNSSFIDILVNWGINSQDDLFEKSFLELQSIDNKILNDSDTENPYRDAAEHARDMLVSKGLSLRKNNIMDLTIIDDDYSISKAVADKLISSGLDAISDLPMVTEEEIIDSKVGVRAVKALKNALEHLGIELKKIDEDEDE